MVLSACVPVTLTPGVSHPTDATGTPNQQVTITIWYQWPKDTLNIIQAALNQYMLDHPSLSIRLVQPENIQDALRVAIPAGKGPDIIDWTNDQIGAQATAGNIISLDALGITQEFLESTYEPAAVKGVIWQGKIWALPESQSGVAIVYNKALVNENDFPADPNDFSDLLTKAKAYNDANQGKFLICNPGLGNPEAYYEAPIYFGFGMPEFVDEAGKVYLNTPEGIAAGNWIKEFKPYAPNSTSEEICTRMFTEGAVAAEWVGPWALAELKDSGIDFGILPMGKPFVGIRTLMIGKNAVDHSTTEIAADIIKYLTSQASEIQLATGSQLIPANTAALNDLQVQALATIKGFGTALRSGVPMANTPYASSQWGPVGDATQSIWIGKQNAEEAMRVAQAAIEEAIAGMK